MAGSALRFQTQSSLVKEELPTHHRTVNLPTKKLSECMILITPAKRRQASKPWIPTTQPQPTTHNRLAVVEPVGIEPTTSSLQSWRSPS
jgi:hypothetical protein